MKSTIDLHSRIPTITDRGQVIRETYQQDGKLRKTCGYMPLADYQLLAPAEIHREVSYTDPPVTLVISITLSDAGRYELTHLEISGGSPISKTFLSNIPFPEIIRKATIKAIPDSGYWLNPSPAGVGGFDDDYLVQLYWFEHLTWGAPRSAIMKATGWSRTNANYHIRRLAKSYDLPGIYAIK